ncbi:MAG: hypothetical protein QXY40_02600 [Candidatus Methanomethylicia archaeon]
MSRAVLDLMFRNLLTLLSNSMVFNGVGGFLVFMFDLKLLV